MYLASDKTRKDSVLSMSATSATVLLSKRVNNYQCMFIADFSGETCMYPDLNWYPVRSMDGLSTSPVVG